MSDFGGIVGLRVIFRFRVIFEFQGFYLGFRVLFGFQDYNSVSGL